MIELLSDTEHNRIRKKPDLKLVWGASLKCALKVGAAALILAGGLLLPRELAFAEETDTTAHEPTEVIDCTGDQFAYGEVVARLNRQTEETVTAQSALTGRKSSGKTEVQAFFAVLCRTDGSTVNFDQWSPACVVA